VGELKKGKTAYKNDAGGNVHVAIGKVSFDNDKLLANAQAFIESLKRSKPQALKGSFIRSVHLSSSMGPAVQISLS